MVRHFEHVTIAVRDVEAAKRFFGLLGFEEEISTVIKGPVMDAYMGVPGIEAEHVTLVLKDAAPRLEVQLLRYRQPSVPDDPRLDRLGFNHVCFAVDDLVAEVARLEAAGVKHDLNSDWGESFRLASRHLIERLREGRRDVELTPADGRRVLEFGLALQRSADENRPVRPDARS